jgi:hypothetical protein
LPGDIHLDGRIVRERVATLPGRPLLFILGAPRQNISTNPQSLPQMSLSVQNDLLPPPAGISAADRRKEDDGGQCQS